MSIILVIAIVQDQLYLINLMIMSLFKKNYCKLLKIIAQTLVLGHADRITNKTLRQIEKEDIKIIEWNVDNLYLDNTLNKLLNRSHCLDGIFSTTADEQITKCVSGNFITFFPNIVDSSVENMQIYKNSNHSKDVFFALSHGVGTGILRKKNTSNEDNDPRVVFMDTLKTNLPNIKFNFFGMRKTANMGK